MKVFILSMDIVVSDRFTLWRKARFYMLSQGIDLSLIGPPERPDVGACLAMLLDRSEHLAGATIEEHRVEEVDI